MIEFYAQIKWVHVAAVAASGALFLLRGLGTLAGARWPMLAPLRYLSYTIDTVLLTAALMLVTILHQYPFVHGWLTVKVLLLVLYIVLGSFALKRGRTPRTRAACFAAAVAVYGCIVSVALTHHSLGALARAFG
ncbi:MAG TPA: SirB2 family protein [Nevskiaceae bacterium]|nr:SirB2 family protein [Nevskiaceae bacterium]